MSNRDTVISHLQIINTWATFHGQYDWHWSSKETEDIARWTKDAIDLLKEDQTELSKSSKAELCRELTKREGVEAKEVEPCEEYELPIVEGPAIVLTVAG